MKKLLIFAAALLLCFAVSATAAENTYTGTVAPINVNTPGEHTVILNGVTIDAVDTPAINVEAPATKLTIVLKNGTTNTLTGGEYQAELYEEEFAVVGHAGIANKDVTLVIRCENAGAGHECGAACGKLIVTGGAYSAGIGGSSSNNTEDYMVDYYRGYEGLNGSVIIEGGNITANGNSKAAGIGGGNFGRFNGTLTINGGNVKAVSTSTAAGIGGGSYGSVSQNASIIINGGNVQATSRYGAGIGAGLSEEFGGFYGTFLVNGGTVTANGGQNAAGIGSVDMGQMNGSVIINGGTVNANGGEHGAGIGSGWSGDGDVDASIIITGGVVNAVGGKGAAGIGGAEDARFTGSLTITGGVVNAVGGENAVGIGANGEEGKMSASIVITGGTVTAIGNGAEAVGAGSGCEMSEEAFVLVDPDSGKIEVKAGNDKNSAAAIDGSPFASKTDVTALLRGKSYARFEKAAPVPAMPATGDSMNVAFFAVLAAAGMICMAILLRRKNEA